MEPPKSRPQRERREILRAIATIVQKYDEGFHNPRACAQSVDWLLWSLGYELCYKKEAQTIPFLKFFKMKEPYERFTIRRAKQILTLEQAKEEDGQYL